MEVHRIAPYHYIHVLDSNSNTTRLVTGPQTTTLQQHESLVAGPALMITVPPRHYTIIKDPAVRDDAGAVVKDEYGQVKLSHGDKKYLISSEDAPLEPFPLWPGESQEGAVEELEVIEKNAALHLKATRDFGERRAGDEWMEEGPMTYSPRVEVEIVDHVNAIVLTASHALKLTAVRAFVDRTGAARKAGESWLWSTPGAYLPSVDEAVECELKARVLTEKTALHLRAVKTFEDAYGETRRAGSEWLVTHEQASEHLQNVHEEIVGEVAITTLSSREYCVVLDPYDGEGVQRLGSKVLRKGEVSFFLLPGEALENGVEPVVVLGEDEALLLAAREGFTDEDSGEVHRPGDRWMISGPREFVPGVEVRVVERRRKIPLDENEGIYVRNNKSGLVRAIIGETYMLSADEELWEKDLPADVESLLQRQALGQTFVSPATSSTGSSSKRLSAARLAPAAAAAAAGVPPPPARDRTRVVQFRVPHNACVQIYDFKERTARVVFGPELVVLMPDEQFTVLSLSGDKPKRPNVIKSLTLILGPDFMTDIVTVETSDHARLKLMLSYNWQFACDREDAAEAAKLFNVRDFTGDTCKAIASRVRGAVSQVSFDAFHKHSAKLIRSSVFGIDATTGKVGDILRFDANNLIVTNVDIQSVEPVDASTRESLQKSVQLAIEITTQSQEARARHLAFEEEEEAKGKLERQKLKNRAEAEAGKTRLLQLQAESAAVESSGQAKAEARARAEAATINGEAAVRQAQLRAEALAIESKTRMELLRQQQEQELAHQRALNAMEVERAQKLSEIESSKFKRVVEAIGADTICAIARAGPEMQAKLLGGLGLQGYLVTDGKSPINLFQTASGLVGQAPGFAAAGAAPAAAAAGDVADA